MLYSVEQCPTMRAKRAYNASTTQYVCVGRAETECGLGTKEGGKEGVRDPFLPETIDGLWAVWL